MHCQVRTLKILEGATSRKALERRMGRVPLEGPRKRAGSRGGKRPGANGARSRCRAAPSMISSLIGSPVEGGHTGDGVTLDDGRPRAASAREVGDRGLIAPPPQITMRYPS